MNKILKTIFLSVCIIAFVLCGTSPCLAAPEHGSLAVVLEDQEKNEINGLTVYLCRIAELNSTGYYPTEAFEDSGISIAGIVNNPDESAAQAVADYVREHRVEAQSSVSENGRATFSRLELGIWLVYCDHEHPYAFNPYIVFLPSEANGELHYEVTSTPKIEENTPDTINIYVVKTWDDQQNAAKKRPQSVTVELLKEGTVIHSVDLNESNGWAYTFSGLEKDGAYSVREKQVPDYKVHYSGDQTNGFIITNTYTEGNHPLTGDQTDLRIWFILLLISGTGILTLAVYDRKRKSAIQK